MTAALDMGDLALECIPLSGCSETWPEDAVRLFLLKLQSVFQQRQAQIAHLDRDHSEDWQALQFDWTHEIVQHALTTCPFYQDLKIHEPNGTPSEWMTTLWYQLPIVDKHDLKTRFNDLWSDKASVLEDLTCWKTSGSTGEPTSFLMDTASILARDVSFWAIQAIRSFPNPDCPPLRTNQPLVVRLASSEGSDRWQKSLPLYDNSLLVKLPAYPHPSCMIETTVAWLRSTRPPFIAADPQAYQTLIEAWQTQFPTKPSYPTPPVSLTCGGNQLSLEARNQIESFFNTPLTDCYGLSETSVIASQCAQGYYHLHLPFNWVEILGANHQPVPEGDLGDVVVTHLLNESMPLIRYRTGDLARLNRQSLCPCGNPLPFLWDLQGRKRRFMIRPDGSLLSPQILVPIFADWVHQFQLIQHTPNTFTLKYRPKINLTPDLKASIRQQLSHHLRAPLHLTFSASRQRLDQPGQKFQDFISECHDSHV